MSSLMQALSFGCFCSEKFTEIRLMATETGCAGFADAVCNKASKRIAQATKKHKPVSQLSKLEVRVFLASCPMACCDALGVG